MARLWTCPKCKVKNERRFTKCRAEGCTGRKRKVSRPAHLSALDEPYEVWVERYGEQCGICGAKPAPKKKLQRDHDHETGEPRGLLCFRCNRFLTRWMTIPWLEAAIRYLRR